VGIVGSLGRLDETLFPDALRYFQRLLERELTGCESLLDVGCGSHSPIRAFSSRIPLTVGVDDHAPSIERSRAAGIHDRYERIDILHVAEAFEPDAFDAVIALDVIEHLEKPDGLRLLDALETVARRVVGVLTPNGYVAQGEYEENPGQVHLSGWTTEEFAERGYRVVGINGWRPLRGELALPRVKPDWLGWRLAKGSQRFVRDHPRRAFHLLALKDIG